MNEALVLTKDPQSEEYIGYSADCDSLLMQQAGTSVL